MTDMKAEASRAYNGVPCRCSDSPGRPFSDRTVQSATVPRNPAYSEYASLAFEPKTSLKYARENIDENTGFTRAFERNMTSSPSALAAASAKPAASVTERDCSRCLPAAFTSVSVSAASTIERPEILFSEATEEQSMYLVWNPLALQNSISATASSEGSG